MKPGKYFRKVDRLSDEELATRIGLLSNTAIYVEEHADKIRRALLDITDKFRRISIQDTTWESSLPKDGSQPNFLVASIIDQCNSNPPRRLGYIPGTVTVFIRGLKIGEEDPSVILFHTDQSYRMHGVHNSRAVASALKDITYGYLVDSGAEFYQMQNLGTKRLHGGLSKR